MLSRWKIVLDPDAAADARAAAWRTLRERVRAPVLFQLRRRIEGWRLTDDLADEVCERLFERHAGSGAHLCLRECVAVEMAALLEERAAPTETDADFERDWASSLFSGALKEFRRVDPDGHRILLRLYDRPEGAPPLTPLQLAKSLDVPAGDVEQRVNEGRAELRRLFEVEIGHTVADDDQTAAEADLLLPRAAALLG